MPEYVSNKSAKTCTRDCTHYTLGDLLLITINGIGNFDVLVLDSNVKFSLLVRMFDVHGRGRGVQHLLRYLRPFQGKVGHEALGEVLVQGRHSLTVIDKDHNYSLYNTGFVQKYMFDFFSAP